MSNLISSSIAVLLVMAAALATVDPRDRVCLDTVNGKGYPSLPPNTPIPFKYDLDKNDLPKDWQSLNNVVVYLYMRNCFIEKSHVYVPNKYNYRLLSFGVCQKSVTIAPSCRQLDLEARNGMKNRRDHDEKKKRFNRNRPLAKIRNRESQDIIIV